MTISNKLHQYGHWALVTGASSGVGNAFAKLFAQNNINCILVSEDEQGLINTLNEINQINQLNHEYRVCDFRNREAVVKLLADESIRQCRIIANCAGVGAVGYFLQHNIALYDDLLEVNVISLLAITHYFCELFYRNHFKGAIINVGSANAELNAPVPFSAVYSAEKSLIKYLTEALNYEMSPFGIDILCVSCGPVVTDFQRRANTNTLSWCESPEHVAIESIKALGKTSSIITNPRTKFLIALYRSIWLPKSIRLKIIAYFFGQILAKAGQTKLER